MSTEAEKRRKDPSASQRSPWWAHAMVVFGALLMVVAGGAAVAGQVAINTVNDSVRSDDLLGDERAQIDVNNIEGPLNFLILGSDQRPDDTDPSLTDAIMIMQVNEDLDRATLVSVPRDLWVPIAPNWYEGKINSAFAVSADWSVGFANSAATLSELTGVKFHGGAIVNFDGFTTLVGELGEIEVCPWTDVYSEHSKVTYPEGCARYAEEQVLDIVRQRKTYSGDLYGDFGRQQMQQHVLKQILIEAKDQGYHTNPNKAVDLLNSLGDNITMDMAEDLRPLDLIVALRDIDPEQFRTVRIPSESCQTAGGSSVCIATYEQQQMAEELFVALQNASLGDWMTRYPEFVNDDA
ncbi:LCP family protein [Natronoglycomyces albus]|uniref:LCP family protein n=1 Tax=Natronoglycomyces albus TaxID=2811108 RepID=A0A895XI61_9ACTN|nr:LCP family protein [Natronoglycomyces albus]QSB05024.1 LCP family protein [Natronoglycomyces albus]